MTEQQKQELLNELTAIRGRYGLRAVCFCATDKESEDLIGFFGVDCRYMDAELFESACNAARLYQSAREQILKPIV